MTESVSGYEVFTQEPERLSKERLEQVVLALRSLLLQTEAELKQTADELSELKEDLRAEAEWD